MAKRENGTGSIVRRKTAHGIKYVAYGPATYTKVDGKRKAERTKIGSFARKSEAQAALDEFRKTPTKKYNYTLRMVYEEWSATAFLDLDKSTVTNWTSCWKKVDECPDPALADKLFREIESAQIRRLLDYYAGNIEGANVKPLSKSYIKKLKSLFTQLYDYAMEYKIVDRNYASLAKLPKLEDSKARAFTDLEFQKLEKNWKTVAGGDACLVLCYTGWRVTEFCELTRFSYDPKAKTLIGGLKTEAGRDRVVPVHPKIQPIIESWYRSSKGPLYPQRNGKAYNKDSFRKRVWNPCMEALGLPDDLTPHSARHTCGTRLSAAGVPAEDIQRIMGHADYSVTANTYINQDVSTLTAAMNKVS